MRHGTANRRSRNNRNNNKNKGGNNRARVYDSNGPEVRIRGTAHQISEKYEALAKDARSSGDMVMAESYLQHAEHYQRIISEMNAQSAAHNNAKQQQQNEAPQNADGNKGDIMTKKSAQNDDLSLPSSILVGKVKAQSESVRALEDA